MWFKANLLISLVVCSVIIPSIVIYGIAFPWCPYCQSSVNVIPIVYGYPDRKLMESAGQGRVVLGGCITEPTEPVWYCKKCDHSWPSLPQKSISLSKTAYTATYRRTDNENSKIEIITVSSDGKGHIFWKNKSADGMYTVLDIPKRRSYLIDPKNKTVTIQAAGARFESALAFDEAEEQLFNCSRNDHQDIKLIGEKIVDNHKCRDWIEKFGVRENHWLFDKQTECLILTEYRDNGKCSYSDRLIKWNYNPMPDESFKIPQDYKTQ